MKTRARWSRLGLLFTLLALLAPAIARAEEVASQPAGWGPFCQDEKDKSWDFPADPAKASDKDWLYLRFRDYDGARPSVAVLVAGNQPPDQKFWEWSDGVHTYKTPIEGYDQSLGAPVAGIEELLTAAMGNTHRYKVLERTDFASVKSEQQLGTQGDAAKESAPAAGHVTGAQYLVKASVNTWNGKAGKSGIGGGGIGSRLGIGGLMNKTKARVQMSFKVIDAMTSEVVYADTKTGQSTGGGFKLGSILATNSALMGAAGGMQNDPEAAAAVMSCINKAVYDIAMKLKARPWKGGVMAVDADKVTINGGESAGLKVGMDLVLVAKGEDLKDPDTGAMIPTLGEQLGHIKVSTVAEKYAFAQMQPGCKKPKYGDVVQIAP